MGMMMGVVLREVMKGREVGTRQEDARYGSKQRGKMCGWNAEGVGEGRDGEISRGRGIELTSGI